MGGITIVREEFPTLCTDSGCNLINQRDEFARRNGRHRLLQYPVDLLVAGIIEPKRTQSKYNSI